LKTKQQALKEVRDMILISVGEAVLGSPVVVEPREKRKRGFGKWLVRHVRRISLLVLNFFLNHDCIFAFVGWFNRRWNFLHNVFVAYAANERYAQAYVAKRFRHWMSWSPWPAGILRQNGKWGLMMVISSLEHDFTDSRNAENLKALVERTEGIRQLLGAEEKTFAGILPGVMYARRLIRHSPEADVTVEAVAQAERELKPAIGYPEDTPLIILGGKGFIGRRLVKRLAEREVYSVDANGDGDKANMGEWPSHLRGRKSILINLTRKAVLTNYLGLFWPELVLLNEVYPEPKREELKRLAEIGAPVYHIVGLRASSYPSFPEAYQGGIPCCAGHPSKDMEVIIKELN